MVNNNNNDNGNKIEDDFLEKVKKVYENCVSKETYANITEFYDEDGVVLMTVEEPDNQPNKLIFSFSEDDKFDYIYNKEETSNLGIDF